MESRYDSEMRYREEELLRIYPDFYKYPEKCCVLWIDSKTLFPYNYDSVEVYISLDGEKIVHNRELLGEQKIFISMPKLTAKIHNDSRWFTAGMKQQEKASGVPVLFGGFCSIEKVQTVTCSWIFTYHNKKGEKNKMVIHTIANVSFNPFTGTNELFPGRDYCLHGTCTSIPSLMEKTEMAERMEIMERYEEIYQGKAELNVRKRYQIPLYSNVIRSSTQIKEDEALGVMNRVLDYLLARNLIDNCDNVIMNVFLDNDKRMLQPMIT